MNIVKRGFKNIFDSVITTLIGVVVMSMTVIMLWAGKITFMWEGVLGLLAGCLLLIAPNDIPKLLKDFFKSKNQNNTPEGD